jgi:hypothetical protein
MFSQKKKVSNLMNLNAQPILLKADVAFWGPFLTSPLAPRGVFHPWGSKFTPRGEVKNGPLFTTLLNKMSWSYLRDTQGFGMQCASFIHHKVASHLGIMVCSWASCQPFSRLPSSCVGLLPHGFWGQFFKRIFAPTRELVPTQRSA